MANEERLRVIIDALNQTEGELGQLEDDLKGVDEKAQDAGAGMGDLKEGLAGAIENVTGLSLESITLAGAVTGVAMALKESIEKAATWGDDMGDLAQITGATVEQTSLMVASFELVGVSADNITQAMKAMTANGMTPNLDTMKRLAKEYQDIQDPVKQNEFLFKNFGKAGLEMAEIMGKSAEELDRLEQAARSSGKVIGEEAAANAEELNLQLAILKQRVDGAQIAVGNFFVPALNSAADGGSNLAKIVGIMNVQTAHMLGLTDDATMRLQAEAVAAGNTFAVFDSSLNPETQEAARLQQAGAEAIDRYGLGLRDYVNDAIAARGATDELSIGFDYTLTATDKLTIGLKSYNEQLLFSLASANMDAEAALNLGVAMGVVDTQALVAAEGVAALKEKYDINADGAISASEATSGYSAAVAALKTALDSIPEQKKVKIEIESYGGNLPQVTGGTGVVAEPRAAGGAFSAGGAVVFNEHPATRPEVVVANPGGGGYVLTQQQAQAALGGGGTGITINGLTIHANTYADGQAAAAGFADEMTRRALVGAMG